MVEQLAIILQALSVILACWAVIVGIDAWKREFIGKRRIEVAEDTLARFFEVKDAIAFIRHPFQAVGEGSTRKKHPGESEADSELLDRAFVVWERYDKKKESFNAFGTQKYRFMASFGASSEAFFRRVQAVVNRVFAAAMMLGTHYWKRQGRVEMEKGELAKHLEEMHKHEGIFWDNLDETNDAIRPELSGIQADFEHTVRPAFEKRMKSYNWLTGPISSLFSRGGNDI